MYDTIFLSSFGSRLNSVPNGLIGIAVSEVFFSMIDLILFEDEKFISGSFILFSVSLLLELKNIDKDFVFCNSFSLDEDSKLSSLFEFAPER